MTDEQININVAEALGWTDCEHIESLGLSKGKHVFVQAQYPTGHSQLPNYCTDLNAMHEAEMTLPTLPDNRRSEFRWRLGLICVQPIHATARQRAEAFLKTLGKWEES
jgi:hypothetical protein